MDELTDAGVAELQGKACIVMDYGKMSCYPSFDGDFLVTWFEGLGCDRQE